MPTDPQPIPLGEKVFMECSKARDCLSRARDGIPDTIYDASQLTYTRDQLNRALAYVASAQMAVDALLTASGLHDAISGIGEQTPPNPPPTEKKAPVAAPTPGPKEKAKGG